MAGVIIPPGGFAGFSQMTPASRARLSQIPRGNGGGGRRRRRKAKKAASGRRRRSGGRRLKFGSPAWQKKYRVGRFAKKRRR